MTRFQGLFEDAGSWRRETPVSDVRYIFILNILICSLLLSACTRRRTPATETPTPTDAPVPTSTRSSTLTPTSKPTSVPTATYIPTQTLTSQVNCTETVAFVLSKVPGAFESTERGMAWCNECLNENGIPTLSYDTGPFCNPITSDAGKVCTDSDQCEGICLAEDGDAESGRCSHTEQVIGCVFEMTKGKSLERCFD